MTLEEIQSRIKANRFVDALRIELRVDEDAYTELKSLLNALAVVMAGRESIQRDLMLYLYPMAQMVWNTAAALESHDPERAAELSERATEIDALVLECLTR